MIKEEAAPTAMALMLRIRGLARNANIPRVLQSHRRLAVPEVSPFFSYQEHLFSTPRGTLSSPLPVSPLPPQTTV